MEKISLDQARLFLRSFFNLYENLLNVDDTTYTKEIVLNNITLTFNQLINASVKNRKRTEYLRDRLESSGIITIKGNWRRNKVGKGQVERGKKQYIRPTALGLEIINLLYNIDQFNKNRNEYFRKISELENNFHSSLPEGFDYKNMMNKDFKQTIGFLFDKGFNMQLLMNHLNDNPVSLFANRYFEVCIFLVLLNSYMRIISSYDLKPQTNDLIKEIVVSEIQNQLEMSQKAEIYDFDGKPLIKARKEEGKFPLDHKTLYFQNMFLDTILDFFCTRIHGDLKISTVSQEITNSTSALLQLAVPPLYTIDYFKNKIDEKSNTTYLENKEEIERLTNNTGKIKEVIQHYENKNSKSTKLLNHLK